MPKVIRLDNLSDQPVVIGAGKGASPVLTEEEKLSALRRQKETLLREIDRLKKDADSIKKKAQDSAETIVTDANTRSEKIRREANDKIDTAKNDAVSIREKAREEGYATGYEEGRKKGEEDGYTEGYAKVKDVISNASSLVDTLTSSRDQLFLSLKEEIALLITEFVRRLTKVELSINENIIMANVKAALSKISSKENITIILSDNDYELVQSHTEELKKMMRGIKNIRFLKEPYIKQGGCEIETDYGSINATIEGQFHELSKSIHKHIGLGPPPGEGGF